MDFLRSPTDPLGGGVGLWTFQQVKSTLKMRGKPIKMPVNPLKTHNFRLLAALLEGLLELLGGVGPWTFPNVQSTLWEGGVGPWTFQKVQPTLREGGVGPWTLKKSETR